jgi:protein-S-isoprenylcysteine O-methyltransferase Ste14
VSTWIAATGMVWVVLEVLVAARPRARAALLRDRYSRLTIALSIFAGIVAWQWLARWHRAPLPGALELWQAIGLVLMLLGMALRFWSVTVLGRYFRVDVTIEPEQRVVELGPYRVLRHPSYAGALLALIGLGLTSGDLLAAIGLTILSAVGIWRRIHVEEQALLDGLGASYRDYMRRTARLVPGLF